MGVFILPAWSVGPSQHKTAEAVFEFIVLFKTFKASTLSLKKYFNRIILYGSYTREKENISIASPDMK